VEQEKEWDAKVHLKAGEHRQANKAAEEAVARRAAAEAKLGALQPFLDVEELPSTHPLRAMGWRAIKQAEERAERAEAREDKEKRRRQRVEGRLADATAAAATTAEEKAEEEDRIWAAKGERADRLERIESSTLGTRSTRERGGASLGAASGPTTELRRSSLNVLEALAGDVSFDTTPSTAPRSWEESPYRLDVGSGEGSSRSENPFRSSAERTDEAMMHRRRRDKWNASPTGASQRGSLLSFYQQSIQNMDDDDDGDEAVAMNPFDGKGFG